MEAEVKDIQPEQMTLPGMEDVRQDGTSVGSISESEGTPVKRKPGRPKKKKEEEEKTVDQLVRNIEDEEMQRPGVKHIFRTISEKNVFTDSGAVPASALESYIQTYLINGWEILNTHFLGKVIEGYTIMYVLVKYQK